MFKHCRENPDVRSLMQAFSIGREKKIPNLIRKMNVDQANGKKKVQHCGRWYSKKSLLSNVSGISVAIFK
ncbi:hypothetical protein DERP_009082 [Dermatophagoides pteronyssinus]|uniref:Uncharacterized protein n=1 Tax=Dermatophagoides pteronyssinus TaxID=6956 RepID=A0ABQ8JGW7_DERPT|nr:hypothetical protein DERP_009082 [Dermatophagoides pteronyssinus]